MSEDGHCLHDVTSALHDASWEGAVETAACSAHAIQPWHLSVSRGVLEAWLLTYPGMRSGVFLDIQ